jgi:hypothetical protein
MENSIKESTSLFSNSRIFEVGHISHSLEPEEWKLSEPTQADELSGTTVYEFFLGAGSKYEVKIQRPTRPSEKEVNVEFYANGDRDNVTNEGYPLRVMATVISIVKDFLQNNPDIDSFSFVPSMADPDDYRRLNLYLRYIKGHFDRPRISVDELGRGYVVVTVRLNTQI